MNMSSLIPFCAMTMGLADTLAENSDYIVIALFYIKFNGRHVSRYPLFTTHFERLPFLGSYSQMYSGGESSSGSVISQGPFRPQSIEADQ